MDFLEKEKWCGKNIHVMNSKPIVISKPLIVKSCFVFWALIKCLPVLFLAQFEKDVRPIRADLARTQWRNHN